MRLYLLYILFAVFSLFAIKWLPDGSADILWTVLAVLAALVLAGVGAPLLMLRRKAGLFVGFGCLLLMLPWLGSGLLDAIQDFNLFSDVIHLLPLQLLFAGFLFIVIELFDDVATPARMSGRWKIALVSTPVITAVATIYVLGAIR